MRDSRVALTKTQLSLGQKPALVVVDACVAFTDPDCPLGADVAAELEVIKGLIKLARVHGWPVHFSTVAYSNPQQAVVFREKVPALNLLVEGSALVAIHPDLQRTAADELLVKTHASCFHGTTFDHTLRNQGVDSLVVCGFTTSGCVRATAVDGLQYDYPTVVVSDASADRDAQAHKSSLYDLQAKYTEVWSSSQLKEMVKTKQNASG